MHRRLAAAAAIFLAVLVPSLPASAANGNQHCVIRVTGQKASGELVTSSPSCYSTFAEAQRSATQPQSGTTAATTSSFIIGIHYDGAGFSGASTTVVGSDCGGGWLNVSAAWDNRISSTQNGCPRIRHFDGTYLTGATEDTVGGGGTLAAMNNRTSSIQYLS
jgi:hypothetical protein